MLPDSHYNKDKADRAVAFIEHLCHTKGKWAGQPFLFLPWQEQIVRDLFGIVKENGKRQFLTAYIEVPKKNGKSELAAAIALYLLYADNEPSAEVYGAACDRNQASIVFDVARQMVEMSPALMRRSKIRTAGKRIINYRNAGFYQVLSAETGTKHGLNVSGLVFDEIHAQPNRKLYDVLTKGSGDAREQPLFFIITTAGNDKNSICYELHTKALDLMAGRKKDYTFYPVVYGLEGEADWTDAVSYTHLTLPTSDLVQSESFPWPHHPNRPRPGSVPERYRESGRGECVQAAQIEYLDFGQHPLDTGTGLRQGKSSY
mgnify:CR=1 FL=1